MSFINKFFKKKEKPIQNNQDFWSWFSENSSIFFDVVKQRERINEDFFNKLAPKLDELKDGYFFVTGLYDKNTAELIFSADGITKNIPFVEKLVEDAPNLQNWKFTALKPESDILDSNISMAGYEFNPEVLSFYSIDHKEYPDEIDITIVHRDFNDDNSASITNGIFIFLDNLLGELNSITTIDHVSVIAKKNAEKELIPIEKLKSFLHWREKEFIEKYEGKRYDTENDNYSALEAQLENGDPMIAIVNQELIHWDSKASHPWILIIQIKYDGTRNNGLPNSSVLEKMNDFEDLIMSDLNDFDGYLNVGRETANNAREIYFACKEFRKPSLLLHQLIKSNSEGLDISYNIVKDKYWQIFRRYAQE